MQEPEQHAAYKTSDRGITKNNGGRIARMPTRNKGHYESNKAPE
jgi:hypothetical protein